jgi:hypothetical protein
MKRRMAWLSVGISLILVFSVYAAHSDRGCDSCHTPHNAKAMAGVPLWNGNETLKSFAGKMYKDAGSGTLDATMAVEPDGSSKLCLSCHDGTNTHTTMGKTAWDDLSVNHPISFVYDSTLATKDGHLKDPSLPSGLGGTIAQDMLENGKVQCVSCHDTHKSAVGVAYLRGYDYFHGTNGGALCRVCHDQ